jgi:hypothetical protein
VFKKKPPRAEKIQTELTAVENLPVARGTAYAYDLTRVDKGSILTWKIDIAWADSTIEPYSFLFKVEVF